jgi:hypothetical protein
VVSSLSGHCIAGDGAPGNSWLGNWLGLRTCLDLVAKRQIPTPAGNRIPVVQPILLNCIVINNADAVGYSGLSPCNTGTDGWISASGCLSVCHCCQAGNLRWSDRPSKVYFRLS